MTDNVLSNADLVKALSDLLKDGADWEDLPVSLKGNVSIQKLPKTLNKNGSQKSPAKLGIKFNPLNKQKSTYFFVAKNYIAYLNDMTESAEGMLKLLKITEKLNGTPTKTTVKAGLKII